MLASRVQSPPGVQAPQSCSARFPLTPVRAFVPRACKRSKATPRPRHPLTVSSFLELRLSTGPVALSPGPRPLPSLRPPTPDIRPRAGPRRSSSRNRPATPDSPCAVSAPLLGPGGHCLLSAPNPPPRNRRRPTRRGGGSAPGERPGRPQPARPTPPGPPPPPPHLARRHCRVSAARAGRRARCAAAPCAVPLPPRW